jgi:adenosylmethionine-8-amino-7-oxononanoate aminotransferase
LAGLTHEPAVRLAAELAAVAPKGLTRVFYSDDGSTAVEAALKMAFQYFRNRGEGHRYRFAAFRGAYHGDTLGAVAVGGIDAYHEIFRPTLMHVVRAPSPQCRACPHERIREECEADCFTALAAALEPFVAELCAVIVEPVVQGAVGMRIYSPAVLRKLRQFCDAHGILLIDDEVAMGFGRTGRMWAIDHAGVSPDILCAAKGLTGGLLPLSVTLASEKIYEAFLGEPGGGKTFYHGHSFTGNPLAAATARASLRLLVEETLPALPERIKALGQVLARFKERTWAADVRQIGMVGAFDLVPPAGLAGGEAGRRVMAAALENGVYLRPLGDTIYFLPPLSITTGEIADLGERVFRSAARVMEA